MNFLITHQNRLPHSIEMIFIAGFAEFLTFHRNVAFLRKLVTRSLKTKCNHRFMQLTPIKSVRDVAFLQQACEPGFAGGLGRGICRAEALSGAVVEEVHGVISFAL